MELVEGKELWEMCNCFGFKNKQTVYFYFLQILKTVAALHEIGIVHRDLKPENVLVQNSDNLIKLIDFGSSKDVIENVASPGNSSTGKKYFEHYMGTPNYMAPECVHNTFSDKRCDIYSLACLFYNLVTGFPPFIGGSEYLIFQEALEKRIHFFDFLFDVDEISMMSRMLDHNAEQRPKIEEVIVFFDLKNKKLISTGFLALVLEKIVNDIKKLTFQSEELFNLHFEELKTKEFSHLDEVELNQVDKQLDFLKKQARHFFKFEDFSYGPFKMKENVELS